mgnify:CR=1 FL=1
MFSDLMQMIWDALMSSTWTRRITFAVALLAILYFWGLNWSALGIWAAIFALHETFSFIGKWWRRRRS